MANSSHPKTCFVRCPRCGGQFDPRVQSSACHKGVRHFPIKRVSEWQPPALPLAPDKPRELADWQSDFILIWDETQPNRRASK
jgi:hypothetical protein